MTTPSTSESEVVDENGGVWRFIRPALGGGSFGKVYRVEGHPVAVKIMHGDESRRERLRLQVAKVRRLPLEDVAVTAPGPLLRAPDVGYIMELAEGMVTLGELIPAERSRPDDLPDWYRETGGVLRRLRVLATLADQIARLHAHAIVYCDLSPGNVMISSDPQATEVRLIDPDNLQFSDPGQRVVYTAYWAAPECNRRQFNLATTLSDAHALAALSYSVLTAAHPLLDGEAAAQREDGDLLALQGLLPWVDHPSDRSNGRTYGVPAEYVMTRRVHELARRAFEAGLSDASHRPSTREWADALQGAATQCVTCPACQMTYLVRLKACPICRSARPRLALLSFGVVPAMEADDEGEYPPVFETTRSRRVVVQDAGPPVELTADLLDARSSSQDAPIGTAELHGSKLRLRFDLEGVWSADGATRKAVTAGRPVDWKVPEHARVSRHLHYGSDAEVHRGLTVRLVREAAT